jgi:sporulation protein YqfC
MSRFARKFRKWTVDVLDLPGDLVFDLPRLTLIGGKQLYIENHRGVIHFSPQELHLELQDGTMEVEGRGLVIRAIMPDEVFVEGTILGIKYRGLGGEE